MKKAAEDFTPVNELLKRVQRARATYLNPVKTEDPHRDPNVPFFERGGSGGDVLMTVGAMTYRIPADHWASNIANVSYYGEDSYGFFRAWEFHGKRPLDPLTTPLSDKPLPDDF